ncbi:MAG: hypothetical protein JW931_03030 [Methanomicrobiaceae archaeon]|nr:hypothetical protein [Methanomicrobiaceae archaeon]
MCRMTFLLFTLFLILSNFGAVCGGSPDEDILISKNTIGILGTSTGGDKIAWLSQYDSYDEYPVSADAEYRIIVHNITSGEEIQIPVNSSRPDNPEISGRYVVWADSVSGSATGYDIYYHDLESGITKTATTEYGDQRNPRIAGDIIIWNELSGPGREYLKKSIFNIADGTLFYFSFDSMTPSGAVTDGKRILSVISNEDFFSLYLYDLNLKDIIPVYEKSGYLWDLALSGDNAAWIEYKWDGDITTDYTIRFFNISSGYMDNFSSGSMPIHGLSIDGNLVVFKYGDYENQYNKNGSDIWYHDFNLHKTALLTERPGSQYGPSVSDGKIVFYDNYHTNRGIYLRYFKKSSGNTKFILDIPYSTKAESTAGAETPGFGLSVIFMGFIMVTIIFWYRIK